MVVILDKKLKKALNKEIVKQMRKNWEEFWKDPKNKADFRKFISIKSEGEVTK